MPYEAKTNWKYDDTVTEKDLNRIEQGLKDAHVAEYKDITLNPGVQIVDVPEDTPFRMGEIRGRTLINLIGPVGSGERADLLQPYDCTLSVDITNGRSSLKVMVNPGKPIGAAFYPNFRFLSGCYYVGISNVKNVDAVCARLSIPGFISGNPVTEDREFGISYVKFSPTTTMVTNIDLAVEGEGKIAYFNSVRLYEISAEEYALLDSMTVDEISKAYPYVDTMTNVVNPYVISTSGNLLPPFSEWDLRKADSVSNPYKLTKVAAVQYDATISPKIRVSRGQTYTLSSNRNGRMVLGEYKEDGTVLRYLIAEEKDNNGNFSKTVTISSDTDYVIVQLSNMAYSGSFSFENTMLTPTVEPQPFAPMNRSMWAAECQLAANPVDETNSDVLYVGDDGLPYVLGKWKKVTLDGTLNWSIGEATFSGGKQVKVAGMATGAVSGSGHAVKFDGKYIPGGSTGLTPDLQAVSANGNFYISISNVDSGWGDAYAPTADEIKAYFLGWKMGWWNSTTQKLDPWDGTQPVHEKRWVNLLTGKAMQTSIPTVLAEDYTPYRLQYLKAKPTVEPVTNYETGLTLSKGWNMVEVGSGIVIREKANPYPNGDGTYSINTLSNPTKYRVDSISSVFRNNMRDVTYSLERREPSSEYVSKLGLGFAKTSDFDPTAVYHVTYTMLDKTLTASINGSIATNLRGTVTDVVQWANDAERRLSVVENQKSEKDAPQWIDFVPMNGWKNAYTIKAGFYLDDGIVRLRGRISGGSIIPSTIIVKLPKGYGIEMSEHIIPTWDGATNSVSPALITVRGNQIELWNTAAGAKDIWLDGITFRTDQ
jgi:hypothetical protein